MTQAKTWVGLDVHAAKVVAAIADAESGELQTRRLSGRTAKVVELCSSLPAPVKVSYEAGPTGFGLARALEQAGVACLIAAPGKIARPATDRVKTDRRDAELLVRLLMAGQLSAVRVPSVREEASGTWSALARTSARTSCARVTASASCCCATTGASTATTGPRRTGSG